MSAIKQIQCPACGANSTFKQTDGSYRCNYCQSNFELKENLKKPQFQKTTVTFDNPVNLKPVKRGCGLVGLMIAISMIGAGVAFFISFKQTTGIADGIETIFTEWQKPNLHHYESFATDKGPVIWLLMKSNKLKLDSVRYPFKIVEPTSGKVLKEGTYLPPMSWKESFYDNKDMDSEFALINNLVWNASENNGLKGFDPFTFEEKENEKTLMNKFPELKSGIGKAEFIRYKKSFKLTTIDGDEFVYYPNRNLLLTQKEDDYSYRKDTITTHELYISDGKIRELWLVKRCTDKTRTVLNLYEGDAKEVEYHHGKKMRFGGILETKKVSDKKFFRAQPLTRHNGNMVVIYTESLKKKSAVILECLNRDGKTVWINKIPELQKLGETTFENLNCDFTTGNGILIFDIYEDSRKSFCYDLNTGKLLWSYTAEK